MTYHLVYPHDENRIAAPWSIGNNLAAALRSVGHNVEQYDWTWAHPIRPQTGDVLIGHPHPAPGYAFSSSLDFLHWSARVAITPWGGEKLTVDLIDAISDRIEHLILICGPYWAERVPNKWRGGVTCVDMAIDWAAYPRIKNDWNPPGKRRALYIGCSGDNKGTPLLEAIIERMPDMDFGHIGAGFVKGATRHGYAMHMNCHEVYDVMRKYDFILHPGKNDANPTTALEGLAWGLLPIATATCGWMWPLTMPSDPEMAVDVLNEWQHAPAELLTSARESRLSSCRSRFTWDNFCRAVLEAL